MDEITQQNAALVEEAAAAAQAMQDQARSLSHAVSVFKLDHAMGQAAMPVTAPKAVRAPVKSSSTASSTGVAVRKAANSVAARPKPAPGSSATDEWEEF
jgi:hypothetical protein